MTEADFADYQAARLDAQNRMALIAEAVEDYSRGQLSPVSALLVIGWISSKNDGQVPSKADMEWAKQAHGMNRE
jgi:hypothetical protein